MYVHQTEAPDSNKLSSLTSFSDVSCHHWVMWAGEPWQISQQQSYKGNQQHKSRESYTTDRPYGKGLRLIQESVGHHAWFHPHQVIKDCLSVTKKIISPPGHQKLDGVMFYLRAMFTRWSRKHTTLYLTNLVLVLGKGKTWDWWSNRALWGLFWKHEIRNLWHTILYNSISSLDSQFFSWMNSHLGS